LFKDKDALLGTKWLDSVGPGWTEMSLHHLVAQTGTLSAAKMKEINGHFRTKMQMKGCEGPYWTLDPTMMVKVEVQHLNGTTKEDARCSACTS
jgi:hypothetical protein